MMMIHNSNPCAEIRLNSRKASEHLERLKHIFVEMEKFYTRLATDKPMTVDVFENCFSKEIVEMVGRISGWEDNILDSMHYLSKECIPLDTWQLLKLDHIRSLIIKMEKQVTYEKYGL